VSKDFTSEERVRSVLLIDRDEKFLKDCSTLLRNRRYHVETGKRFFDAVKKLGESHFDFLIMDVDLPEIKGYKAVPILRNLSPNLRIVLTTDRNSRRLELKVREQNIFYYFIKSFGTSELVMAVDNAFKGEAAGDAT
jgi:DNA-binding NtrC family response regulator